MELIEGLENQSVDDDEQKRLLKAAGVKEVVTSKTSSGEHEIRYWDLSVAERIKFVQDHGCGGISPQADELPAPYPDYAAQPRSYRDLPLRLAEFGTVYRYEQSGELSGLTRVRGFTQDDAHLFCTPDQVREEFRSTIELDAVCLQLPGLDRLSTPAVQE